MTTKNKLWLVAGVLLVTVFAINGCKEKSEPAPPAPPATPGAAVGAAIDAIEQTTCPVMEGGKINKAIYTEYKGKKVYFCCAGCKPKFEANPEQYLAKLPQFKD